MTKSQSLATVGSRLTAASRAQTMSRAAERMRWPPSKDPEDYRTPGRWENRQPPQWISRLPRPLAWLFRRWGAPYHYSLLAGFAGLVVGAAVGGLLSWDAGVSALVGAFIAQAGIEVWWWRRERRQRAAAVHEDG
jgi:hypothetical protein